MSMTPDMIEEELERIRSRLTRLEGPEGADVEALRAALLGTAAWTLEDGSPCWCGPCPPIEEDGDEHMDECKAARVALRPFAGGTA